MSHHRSIEDLVRTVTIPDESPLQGLPSSGTKGSMSMVAGDFLECYSSPSDAGSFSVVVTVFFIDTAANVLKYIDTIHHVLERGGVWINLGPLAWHFESDPGDAHTNPRTGGGNIELTLTEVIQVILKSGFKFETGEGLDQHTISTPYMANSKGMLTYVYDAEFWVARKL
jgi:carnosine N-methyltransferase